MTDNFWSGLNRGIGGTIDAFSNNKWDMDGLNPGERGNAPAAAASDGFNFGDAMDAFTKGYSATMGGGGSTPGGSSFLNAYASGKSSTPTTTSPVSTSSVFTGGGGSQSMPGVVINQPVDFYALKDNVQYPTQQGGSGGGSKSGGLLDTVGKAVGIAGGLKAAFPLTFAGLCDIRTKTDIAPLITTEVNDDLAQVAFFVKELRECS